MTNHGFDRTAVRVILYWFYNKLPNSLTQMSWYHLPFLCLSQIARWTKKSLLFYLKRTKTLLRIMKCWIEFCGRRNKKSHSRPNQYQKQIPENVKKEIGKHASIFGTSPIKRFWLKYPKQSLISSSMINCKIRFKGGCGGDVVL